MELLEDSGNWIPAELGNGLSDLVLKRFEEEWVPGLVQLGAPDAHWNWRKLWREFGSDQSHRFYHLDCQDSLQGLLWIEKAGATSCSSPGEPLVYVHRLAAAPWNRGLAMGRRFRPVGMILLRQAVVWSLECGCTGAIGLHSLPEASEWYRDKLQMNYFGVDNDHEGLD